MESGVEVVDPKLTEPESVKLGLGLELMKLGAVKVEMDLY